MTTAQTINLLWELEREPPPFEGNDIKFPESLARHIIKTYTKKGDKVLDPFTGLGTTLFVAEELNRTPFGFETDTDKHQWVAGQLEHWTHHIHDDAYNVPNYHLPKIDLLLTSPPYMPRHHKFNPLYNGDPQKAGYDCYLKRLAQIFKRIRPILKKNTPVILHLDNLKHGTKFTPLVHDVAGALSKDYCLCDEIKIIWDNPKLDYLTTQYLVFKKR
ncbi:MAG: DNA methyltransferase [Pseudomonadota bacterium]